MSLELEMAGNAVACDEPRADDEGHATQPRAVEDPPALLAMLWVGFILVHIACWRLILIAVNIGFWTGFFAEVVYLCFLIFLAWTVGRTNRFVSFRSIVWILACVAVFSIGEIVAEIVFDRFGPPGIEGYGDGFVLLVLGFAMAPMLLLALCVLCRSEAKGTFLNLYYGLIYAAVLVIELPRGGRFPGLLAVVFEYQDFLLVIFAATYFLVALVSLCFDFSERFRSIRPWVAGCAVVPMWLLLHDLIGRHFFSGTYSMPYVYEEYSMPSGDFIVELEAFMIYAAFALAQIALALLVDELVPMVLAGVSLLVAASQGSLMAGKAVGEMTAASFPNAAELAEVAQLATLAVLGALVLFISILFAFRRKAIEEMVREGKEQFRHGMLGKPAEEALPAENAETKATNDSADAEAVVAV